MSNNIFSQFLKLKNQHFFVIDAILFCLTPLIALVIHLDDFSKLELYKENLLIVTIIFLLIKLILFHQFGFYKRYWRYASIDELAQIATLTATVILVQIFVLQGISELINSSINMLPISLPILDGIFTFMFVGGLRFSIRAIERLNERRYKIKQSDRVLIIGAGHAGISLVQEMQRNSRLGLLPVAFIDDDPAKSSLHIRGIYVVGNRYKIPEVVHYLNIDKIIIAIPSASGKTIKEIVDICQDTGIKTSTLPGINEILNGRINLNSIRSIKIEDLLRREPIQTDVEGIAKFLKGKKVLITGAGGSIGSEICRQILKCNPKEIALLGHGENSIFNIEQELKQILQLQEKDDSSPRTLPRLTSFIADIRFIPRLAQVFTQFKPDVIFHAAAHKHVPLMELNPAEAITNNVLGTQNLVELALKHNIQHFVMISTDKAVNPTNVMGASKRTAEMVVLQAAKRSGRCFGVVRFGNVLGSRGSVVPIFQRQIMAGGPITVTHPDICRYFMTIPEAVQLTLQASVLGRGGEIVMLNMGEPVKIVDLAKQLIRLSGYEPDKDIAIKFTGLRPGEKLFEELFIAGEDYEPTDHDKLFIARNASSIIAKNLDLKVNALVQAAANNDTNLIIFLLEQLVQGYKPKYRNTYVAANMSQKKAQTPRLTNHSGLTTDDLRRGFNHHEFRLHYQPIISLNNNQLIGFEAFLRWLHPQRGLIHAKEFLSIAKKTGLIIPIGWWVLFEACCQMESWQKQFPDISPLTINMNFASQQLLQPDFVKQISRVLHEISLEPSCLRLEISENFVKHNPVSASSILRQLRSLGIQLQLDNFGTGWSSSSCLEDLPKLLEGKFDRLKISPYLISQIASDEAKLEFVHTIKQVTDELGMDMIATGIETSQQIEQLKNLKCKYGQGYFVSKPVGVQVAKTMIELPILIQDDSEQK